MHPFKKGQHILFSGVTKGRRGPRVELTRKNVRPNHAGFLLQRHARVRRAATGTFFLLSSSSYSRVLLQNVFYLLIPHTQKNFSVGVLLRESFSTAPSDSAFSHKEEKKEKKFSPFFCASKSQEDAFLIHQNSSEVLTCVLYIIHILSSRSDYYDYYDFKNR